jgi:hypothetical protein
MTLSHEQIEDLRQTYAEMVVDSMDMETLVSFAIDSIVDALPVNEQQLKQEIIDLYDEEMYEDLLESVTNSAG